MNDYIQEARRIVTGYFAALAPSEQLRRETAQELRQGHITEGYARELTLSANSEAFKLRQNAQGQLDALARRFASAATAADTPDGNALQGGDYRLLAENFPMSVEEFSTLCERNKNNPTLLRKAMEYGDKHGGMAPYLRRYAGAVQVLPGFQAVHIQPRGPTHPRRGPPQRQEDSTTCRPVDSVQCGHYAIQGQDCPG